MTGSVVRSFAGRRLTGRGDRLLVDRAGTVWLMDIRTGAEYALAPSPSDAIDFVWEADLLGWSACCSTSGVRTQTEVFRLGAALVPRGAGSDCDTRRAGLGSWAAAVGHTGVGVGAFDLGNALPAGLERL